MLHKNLITGDNHFIQQWDVSDSNARTALSSAFASNDIGKVAHQTNDSKFFILQETVGAGSWLEIGSGGGGGGPAISAGTNSRSTGTVNFSNSNNVTFGMGTNGVVTASASFAGGGGGVAMSAGTISTSTGTVKFADSNGITFGMNTNSQITASKNGFVSVDAGAVQGTGDVLSLIDSNGISFGANVFGGVTASVQNQAFIAGTQTGRPNTLSFLNAGGVSFGLSGSSRLTASVEAHNVTLSGNTAGVMAQVSTGVMTLAGGNNITLSQNGNAITISGGAGGGAGAAISLSGNSTSAGAGYSNITSGTAFFAGGNNITLSQNGASITISGANVGGAQTGISSIAVSNTTYTSGQMSFRDGNNISFASGTGQAVSITHNLQSAGAYLTTAAQSSLSNVSLVIAGTASNGGTASLSGGVSFSNANGVSFYTSAGNAVVATVATNYQSQGAYLTTARASNDAIGLNTALTANGVSMTANSSGLSLNFPAFLTTAAQSSVSNVSGVIAGTNSTGGTATLSGNVSFSNANGVSFFTSAGNAIVATVATNYQSQGAYLTTARASNDGIGLNTAQSNVTWTVNSSGLSLDARGYAGTGTTTAGTNASLSMTLNSAGLNLAVSVNNAGAANAAAISIGGNSTSAGAGYSNISSGTAVFMGGNNITLSQNGNSITISGANVGGAQTGISGIIASNATYTSGTISFSDANGISFGTGAGQAINITHGLQFTSNTSNITSNALHTSASRVINIVAATNNTGGGTASLSSNVSFSNANGLTFYTSAGGAVVGSYTVPTQSVQTQSTVAINGSTGAISFSNSNNVTFGFNASTVTASASFAQSTQTQNLHNVTLSGNTAGVMAQISSGTLSLAGGNNITLSQNGNAVTISGANTVAQSAMGFSGTNGSFTASTLTFGNLNGLSFYTSNNSIVGSYTVPAGGASPNFSAGTTSNNLGSVVFSNSNGVSFGLNGSTITASVNAGGGAFSAGISTNGNTSGTTGLAGNQLVFQGGNNVTLSQITGVGGSNTLIISAANSLAAGAIAAGTQTAQSGTLIFSNSNNVTFGMSNNSVITASVNVATTPAISTWVNIYPGSTASIVVGNIGISTASAYFFPILVENNVNFNCLQILQNLLYTTSNVSGQQSVTCRYGLFSNNAGTLSQISSGSYSMAATGSSVSATINYPVSTNTLGYTYTTQSHTATNPLQSNFGSVGYRHMDLVFGNTMSLSPGVYWLGLHNRFSSSSANIGWSLGYVGNQELPRGSFGGLGFASSASTTNFGQFRQPFGGYGVYTSTGSAGHSGTNLPASAFLSGFNNNNFNTMPFMTLISTT